MLIMRMMQMTVVQVVCMILVFNARMSARSAVRVLVFLVGCVSHRRYVLQIRSIVRLFYHHGLRSRQHAKR